MTARSTLSDPDDSLGLRLCREQLSRHSSAQLSKRLRGAARRSRERTALLRARATLTVHSELCMQVQRRLAEIDVEGAFDEELIREAQRRLTARAQPQRGLVRRVTVQDLLCTFPGKLTLAGSGRWKAFCPFHNDRRTPNLWVYSDGHFHCYGCQQHGSLIDLLGAWRQDALP